MPKGRLVFDGDNLYTEKEARVYKLKQEISSKIDAIPGVIDDLNSTSTTDALSANMGRELQDQISALSGNFHFLSTWDCTTGLPGTNPVEDPYNYESGDYYIVSMVAGSGGTNYKPQGGSYVQGVPSTAVETGTVNLSDWYVYDGATWILQPAGSWHIIVDDQLDATSTNPVQNRIITQALANKQNTITNLSTIESGAAAGATALQPGDNISSLTNNSGYQTAGDVAAALGDVIHTGATAPSNPTEGQLWYDTTNDVLKVYDGTQWNIVGVNGSDVNTKTFPLSGTTGATALAEAQAIYDWYDAGKNPLILYNEEIYLFYSELTNSISFITPHSQRSDLGTTSFIMQRTLTLTLSSGTVSSITASDTMVQGLLMTGYDYPTPYVPEYNGSPSNKKYVDDKVRSAISVIATAPSTPTEGMLWYDTTNDVLKVYDGTQWNIVGGSGTTYTAGDNIDITNDTISVENVIVTDNTNDTGFRIEDGELTDGQFYIDTTDSGYVESGFEKDSSSEYVFRFAYLDGGNSMIGVSASQQDLDTGDEYSFDISIDALTGIVASRSITDDGQTTSTSENYNVFSEYEGDPNKIAKIGDIKNVINSGTTSPSDPTEGQLWYDTTNHVLKVYNGTTWVALDTNTTYTAGTGISIDANNEISNTGVLSSNNTYNNIVYLSQSDYDNLQNKDANTLYSTPDGNDISFVDDTAYAASWDGDTTHAPSKNAVYDKVNSMKEFVASEGAVKVFAMPSAGDDISDIVSWLDTGGGVILKEDVSSTPGEDMFFYYQVSYWSDDDSYFDYFSLEQGTISDVHLGTVSYNSSKIVNSNTNYTRGSVPVNGTAGQVLKWEGNAPTWGNAPTGTTYTAGEGIDILNGDDYSAMRGPCSAGYHVPTKNELDAVKSVWTALGGLTTEGDNFSTALKLPFAGACEGSISGRGTYGWYWSSSYNNIGRGFLLCFTSSDINANTTWGSILGCSIRPFKDEPITPTSSWVKLYGTSIESGGIFWSSTDGLISLSSDGSNWITIADKNLGATTVWNSGDTLSEANCGKYFQWGNNYMFPFSGATTTSSTQVDASNYGPGNYYSSSTFITGSFFSWDSSDNPNLWGGVTGVVTLNNAITVDKDSIVGGGWTSLGTFVTKCSQNGTRHEVHYSNENIPGSWSETYTFRGIGWIWIREFHGASAAASVYINGITVLYENTGSGTYDVKERIGPFTMGAGDTVTFNCTSGGSSGTLKATVYDYY